MWNWIISTHDESTEPARLVVLHGDTDPSNALRWVVFRVQDGMNPFINGIDMNRRDEFLALFGAKGEAALREYESDYNDGE